MPYTTTFNTAADYALFALNQVRATVPHRRAEIERIYQCWLVCRTDLAQVLHDLYFSVPGITCMRVVRYSIVPH